MQGDPNTSLAPPLAPPPRTDLLNVGLFVGVLLVLGVALGFRLLVDTGQVEVSTEENRTLAPVPELRWAAIVDGSFALRVDEWIADHVAGRTQFLALHFWLEGHRGLHSDDDDDAIALYEIEIDNDAELEPLDDEIMDELALEPLDDDAGDVDEDDDEDEDFADAIANPQSIVKTEGILVADGRAMQLFAGSPRGSHRYAKVVNEYADALRGKAKLYSLIVPTAQTFYLPASYTDRVRHEPPNIAATYAMMNPSVVTVDVVGALTGHASEYIYFRTDHHWTGLGAYYAYVGFCAAAGLDPVALDSMVQASIEPYRGSLYRYTRDSKLKRRPDQIEYWIPAGDVSVQRGSRGQAKLGALLREESKGYGVFLGGDQPLLIARGTANTGRRVLLIKNSYGNPFAVYLVAHFDEVVIVDYRKFDGSVLDLVDEHHITDVIVLNGAITSNAKSHVARIALLLNAGKRVPSARRGTVK